MNFHVSSLYALPLRNLRAGLRFALSLRYLRAGLKAFLLSLTFASGALAGPLEDGQAAFDAGQYETAMQFFSEGFRSGDAASGYYLARMLELGLGIEPDPVAALQLYQLAAESGNVEALNRVALMHYRGEAGIIQDYAEAARLFALAAEQEDRNALFNLGKLYFEGKGVRRNASRAIGYYRRAAEKDHILALNTLGALYRAGAKSAEDLARARKYFERSGAFGNAVGLFEVARKSAGGIAWAWAIPAPISTARTATWGYLRSPLT